MTTAAEHFDPLGPLSRAGVGVPIAEPLARDANQLPESACLAIASDNGLFISGLEPEPSDERLFERLAGFAVHVAKLDTFQLEPIRRQRAFEPRDALRALERTIEAKLGHSVPTQPSALVELALASAPNEARFAMLSCSSSVRVEGFAQLRSARTGEVDLFGRADVRGDRPMPLRDWASADQRARMVADLQSVELAAQYPCRVRFTVDEDGVRYWRVEHADLSTVAAIRAWADLAIADVVTTSHALRALRDRGAHLLTKTTLLGVPAQPLATGVGACAGVAVGAIVTNPEAVLTAEEPVILVRGETSAPDVAAIQAAAGVVTAGGGLTSHAAIVSRRFETPCVTGVNELFVHADDALCRFAGHELRDGDVISIEGTTGAIYAGRVAAVNGPVSAPLFELLAKRESTKVVSFVRSIEELRHAERIGVLPLVPADRPDLHTSTETLVVPFSPNDLDDDVLHGATVSQSGELSLLRIEGHTATVKQEPEPTEAFVLDGFDPRIIDAAASIRVGYLVCSLRYALDVQIYLGGFEHDP